MGQGAGVGVGPIKQEESAAGTRRLARLRMCLAVCWVIGQGS